MGEGGSSFWLGNALHTRIQEDVRRCLSVNSTRQYASETLLEAGVGRTKTVAAESDRWQRSAHGTRATPRQGSTARPRIATFVYCPTIVYLCAAVGRTAANHFLFCPCYEQSAAARWRLNVFSRCCSLAHSRALLLASDTSLFRFASSAPPAPLACVPTAPTPVEASFSGAAPAAPPDPPVVAFLVCFFLTRGTPPPLTLAFRTFGGATTGIWHSGELATRRHLQTARHIMKKSVNNTEITHCFRQPVRFRFRRRKRGRDERTGDKEGKMQNKKERGRAETTAFPGRGGRGLSPAEGPIRKPSNLTAKARKGREGREQGKR